ncbi:MAG TPA: glycosyltransferase family 39 protein, partial [Microlunatus sp.]
APRPSRLSRVAALWPLWIALALGIALRVIVTRSIWVDEAISIQQAQLPYSEMIRTLRDDDVHPPLFHTILWALVHLTGSTAEIVVRLPSLIAGTACIPVSYAMAKDLWGRRTAIVAAYVVAVAPVAVWYSQEARMYGLWMLGATILAWNQIRILRDVRDGRGFGTAADWVGFTLLSVGMIYLQWFTALAIIVQHLIFAVAAIKIRKPKFVRNWLISGAAQLILFAPLMPYMIVQFSSIISAQGASSAPSQTESSVSSSKPDVYAIVANTIWGIWGYHADSTMVQLGALWPVAVLLCFVALGRGRDRNTVMILLIGVLPAAALFLIGFERRQFFELRYFASTVPMLLLLVARMASTWGRGPLTKIMIPVVTIGSLGAGLIDQQINQSNPRVYDFRGAVSWVKANSQPQDVVLYAPNFLRHELDYYPSGLTTLDANTAHPNRAATGMPAIPADGRRVFVFGSFLGERQVAAQVGGVLSGLEQTENTTRVGVHEVANVKVWEFKQLPPDRDAGSTPEKGNR